MSRLLSRLKGLAHSSPGKPKASQSSPRDSQVFELPEILENIFAYLSPHKRRTVAALVCKQWLAIVQHLALPSDFVWDIKASKEQRLSSLLDAITSPSRTLILRGNDQRHIGQTGDGNNTEHVGNPSKEPSDLALTELRQALSGSSPTASSIRLRELVLDPTISRGMLKICEILDLAGHSLRILRVVHSQPVLPETLSTILLACPQLDSLTILMPPAQRTFLPLPRVPVTPAEPSNVLSAAMATQRPLRNLVLQQPVVTEDLLKLILSLTHLTQLRVLDGILAEMPSVENDPPIAIQVNLAAFLAQLSLACPMLNRLQLSCNQRNVGETSFMLLNRDLFRTMRASSPGEDIGIELANLKELSFQDTEISGGDMFPRSVLMLAMLAPLTDNRARATLIKGHPRQWAFGHLTRLEILPPNHEGCLIPSFQSLHTFLCHAPTLEHLIAPNVMIEYEDLDWELVLPLKASESENYRGMKYAVAPKEAKKRDTYKELQSHQRFRGPPTHVWACRRLRTLHIAFPEPSWSDTAWYLILFGYISKACPRLSDLQITKQTMSLRPKDGFCLLGRLHNLERLAFVTTHAYFLDPRSSMKIQEDKKLYQTFEDELEWMRRFPKGYNGRSFETLSLGIYFSPLEDSRQEIFEGRGTRLSRNKARDQGWDDLNLSSLGTLKDVKDWKFERTRDLTDGQPLWPVLEKLEIRYTNIEYQSEGRKLQKYLARIRPDIKADIHSSDGKEFPVIRIG